MISLDHVWFHRGSNVVLEDLTLDAPPQCFVGIIGPNGGGKTTLVKLLLGLLHPSRGTVTVLGQEVRQPGQFGSDVGYVPQRSDIDWTFPARVIDVVAMGAFGRLGLTRRVPPAVREEARERLSWVSLAEKAEEPIGRLSCGQQRRAFIARALMGEPRLLILDEPAAGLDTAAHCQLLGQLRMLQQRLGMTVVMVSHDIGELASAADRIACINRTLHWHSHAEALSDEVLESVYACELKAYRVHHHHEICHQES